MRPRLHRYCARMTGSVFDGEDVLQDAMLKAVQAFPQQEEAIGNIEAWVFRIAHNAALDFLRRRARQDVPLSEEAAEMIIDPAANAESRLAAAASLRTFMRLPPAQRGSVVLMDVLGYSLQEIGEVFEASIPAVKASLHKGRARLRELAEEQSPPVQPILPESQRRLLSAYVDRFNARDFDAIRNMLADDVRLDMVAGRSLRGSKQVGRYFTNYDAIPGWRLTPALVEGRPAALVHDAGRDGVAYAIFLSWDSNHVIAIRDFYYARYVMDGAEITLLDDD
jgi:RNA polymerase sigma-70 factor (ECF subfamily)